VPCIELKRESTIPLYRQIVAALTTAIADGTLRPDERLPPIRTLARQLGVGQITVAQAYNVLIAEGRIASHVGRGTFVREPSAEPRAAPPGPRTVSSIASSPAPIPTALPPDSAEAGTARRDEPGQRAGTLAAPITALVAPTAPTRWQVIRLGLEQILRRAPHAEESIDFSSGVPDPALFPLRRWRQSMRLAADRITADDRTAVQYGPALGEPLLRAHLAATLHRYGIRADPDEILLTSGTQQSLDVVARTFLQPGDTAFVEELSYIAALEVLEQRQPAWQPLPVDAQGLQIEALPVVAAPALARPRLLYTIPTGHSPTGYSLSVARRQRLVELAERYNLLVVADEAFCELYLDGSGPLPAVQSFASSGRVMSLVSFSKTIFPGVRMGCIVAGRPLIERLAQTKAIIDREVALPLARAVLQHIRAPAYARELAHARTHYRTRRDQLLDLLQRELAALGCQWTTPAAGFSLLVTLPPGCEEMAVVAEAAWQGVLVLPGQCFAPLPTARWHNTIRLTYGDVSAEQLHEGVQRLARALRLVRERPTGRRGSTPLEALPNLL
jgi:DNA-binding transcriptional MocR family regulator